MSLAMFRKAHAFWESFIRTANQPPDDDGDDGDKAKQIITIAANEEVNNNSTSDFVDPSCVVKTELDAVNNGSDIEYLDYELLDSIDDSSNVGEHKDEKCTENGTECHDDVEEMKINKTASSDWNCNVCNRTFSSG